MSAILHRIFPNNEPESEDIVNEETVPENIYVLAANKAASEFTYGGIIKKIWMIEQFNMIDDPLSKIEEGFDIDELRKDMRNYEFDLLHNISGFKDHLLEEHRMHIISIGNGEYQITLPKQQTDVAITHMKKSISKEIRRATRILTNVNESLLSDDEIKKRNDTYGRLAAIELFSKKRQAAF